jgi:hypothetical protein
MKILNINTTTPYDINMKHLHVNTNFIKIESAPYSINIHTLGNFIQVTIYQKTVLYDKMYIMHLDFKKYNETYKLMIEQIVFDRQFDSQFLDLLIKMDIIKATKESFCITDHILLQLL